MASIETRRISEASSGKMPTTSMRRPISRLKRSSGFVDLSLGQCSAGGVEREHVVFGVLEHGGDLRQAALELADRLAQPLARLSAIGGGEQRSDQGAQRVMLVLADMAAQVAQEVHRAALPRRAEDLRERRLEARMGV